MHRLLRFIMHPSRHFSVITLVQHQNPRQPNAEGERFYTFKQFSIIIRGAIADIIRTVFLRTDPQQGLRNLTVLFDMSKKHCFQLFHFNTLKDQLLAFVTTLMNFSPPRPMKVIITLQHDYWLTTGQVTTLWSFFGSLADILCHLLQPFTPEPTIHERAILGTTLENFHAWEPSLFHDRHRSDPDHSDQGIFFRTRFTPVLCLAHQEIEPLFYHSVKTGLFQLTYNMCKLTVYETLNSERNHPVQLQLRRFNHHGQYDFISALQPYIFYWTLNVL